MKIADYYQKDPRESLILNTNSKDPLDRMFRGTSDNEFPIKILDDIISVEEQIYGFSLYNRGQDLKKSLIDPQKVKSFI